jgi:hypothetical protein
MKHMHFIPKAMGIVLAASLFVASNATAQESTFAYHAERPVKTAAKASEAPSPFKMRLTQMEGDSLVFRLSVENPGAGKLILFIKDGNNNTLHREVLPSAVAFSNRYNLQGLEDGSYIFEIRDGRQKIAEKTIGIRTEMLVSRSVAVK